MKLLQILFGNPGIKLLALLMAWGVWYIAREDLTENARLTASVEVFVEDENEFEAGVSVPETGLIDVTVSGPQRAVSGFQLLPPRVVARVTPDMLAGGEDEKVVTFDVKSLEFPDVASFSDLRVTTVTPDKLKVNVRRMVVESKTVQDPEGLGDERHGVRFELESFDSRVDVRGARVNLRDLLAIKTYADAAELEQYATNMGQDEFRRSVTLRLLIADEQKDLFELVGRTHLTAKVALIQMDERDIDLPLDIHYVFDPTGVAPAAGSLSFSEANDLQHGEYYVPADPDKEQPTRVRVRLRGVPRALESLDTEKLLAYVFANDLKLTPDARSGSVNVRVDGLPPGVTLLKEYPLVLTTAE